MGRLQGLDALKVTWDEGPNAKINSADIWNDLRAASKKDGVVAKSEGDIDKGLTQGERFDADYECRCSPMPPWNR